MGFNTTRAINKVVKGDTYEYEKWTDMRIDCSDTDTRYNECCCSTNE
jgi:hypothetical protein